jgi:hypothetical protein
MRGQYSEMAEYGLPKAPDGCNKQSNKSFICHMD